MAGIVVFEPTRREDAAFHALARASQEGLKRREPRTASDLIGPSGRDVLRFFGLLLALALLAGLAFVARSRPWRTDAAPAFTQDAADFVHSDADASSGRFLILAVRHRGPVQFSASDMRWSQRSAVAAAQRCVAERIPGGAISFTTLGQRGASGGLMFGLQIVDFLRRDDLTAGRRIAGTGALSSDGRVWPVLEIAEKAVAAEQARVDFFFVPASQVAAVRQTTTTLRVIPIKTLSDAVRFLDGRGCRR